MADAVSATGSRERARNIGPPAADDGAKRRQIMEGAREIFMSAGFDAASMNDIARAAGVSKGTLYAYFDSKEALFEALIREERAHQPERNMHVSRRRARPGEGAGDLRPRAGGEDHPRRKRSPRPASSSFAAAKFPRLGQAFYEAGPLYGVRKLTERLDAFVAAGTLADRRHRRWRRASSSTCALATSSSGCCSWSTSTVAGGDRRPSTRRSRSIKAYGAPPRG